MSGPAGQRREVTASPDALLQLALRYPDRYPVFLDSAGEGPLATQNLLFRSQGAALTRDASGRLSGSHATPAANFFDALRSWFAEFAPRARSADWLGGWVLYLGYECAADIESVLRLPLSPDSVSACAVWCPVQLAARPGSAKVVISGAADSAALIDACTADLLALQQPAPLATQLFGPFVALEDPPEIYLHAVQRAKAHIAAGDVYQANLSRAWRAPFAADSRSVIATLYPRLRSANPGPFAALFQWGTFAVLSSSPERLLRLDGTMASTRPIAGTRPRSNRPDADRAEIAALVAHPKERAEHIMLIDLERNDLGRVCEGGSVEVDEFLAVESYRHVHHIVSNVRGRLRAGVSPIDALQAVFPGGTITGVPKIRCMQLIAELEGQGRGAYTGSLGYIGLNGHSDFNILIRSLVIDNQQIRFRTGAGIVADSEPLRELEETRAKARGLLAALGMES